jgi:hypothetical protein
VDEEDKYLIEVGEVGPRFNKEAKLLLKVTTKANLLRRRGRGSKEGGGEEKSEEREKKRAKLI